jgi:hypothetical protein
MRVSVPTSALCLVVACAFTGAATAHAADAGEVDRLILVGVVLGAEDDAIAVIENQRTGGQRLYHVGEQVGALVVLAIKPDRAVLRGGDEQVELRLATARRTTTPVVRRAPPRAPFSRRLPRTGIR